MSWLRRAVLWPLLPVAVVAACSVRVGGRREVALAPELACDTSEQCPAPDSLCLASMCLDGECVYVAAPRGPLPAEDQRSGDCQQLYCDGDGGVERFDNPGDVPPDDGNRCTEAACDGGRPQQLARAAGVLCAEEGPDGASGSQKICTGTGHCGVCLPAAQRCDGAAVVSCDDHGQWQPKQLCKDVQPVCRAAHCTGVVQLAAGRAHVCARFDDGSLRCWGKDGSGWSAGGQPTLPWARDYVQLAVGTNHSCGVRRDGSLWCWGRNGFGQLGDGSLTFRAAPVKVPLAAVAAVAVGRGHSCARMRDGKVRCWGRNDHGQLGSGTVTALSGADVTAALAPTTGPPLSAPLLLAGVSASAAISTPGVAVCTAGGCFGARPRYVPVAAAPAQEQDDAARHNAIEARLKRVRATPTAVGIDQVTQLACGDDHCCARDRAGRVHCWGANQHGQLAVAGPDRAAPAIVKELTAVTALSLGANFGCALHHGGKVSCFGDGRAGQLGGDKPVAGAALVTPALTDVTQLAVGGHFACALRASGKVSCWGALAAAGAAARAPHHDIDW